MVLYVYVSLFDYSKPRTALDEVIVPVSFVLCPPSLLLFLCIDCQVEGLSGAFLFLLIGLMNAGLYSIIGFPFYVSENSAYGTVEVSRPLHQLRPLM